MTSTICRACVRFERTQLALGDVRKAERASAPTHHRRRPRGNSGDRRVKRRTIKIYGGSRENLSYTARIPCGIDFGGRDTLFYEWHSYGLFLKAKKSNNDTLDIVKGIYKATNNEIPTPRLSMGIRPSNIKGRGFFRRPWSLRSRVGACRLCLSSAFFFLPSHVREHGSGVGYKNAHARALSSKSQMSRTFVD